MLQRGKRKGKTRESRRKLPQTRKRYNDKDPQRIWNMIDRMKKIKKVKKMRRFTPHAFRRLQQ